MGLAGTTAAHAFNRRAQDKGGDLGNAPIGKQPDAVKWFPHQEFAKPVLTDWPSVLI